MSDDGNKRLGKITHATFGMGGSYIGARLESWRVLMEVV